MGNVTCRSTFDHSKTQSKLNQNPVPAKKPAGAHIVCLPSSQSSWLEQEIVQCLNSSHAMFRHTLKRILDFCYSGITALYPTIRFNCNLHVIGGVYVISLVYKSPHVTFKSGYTAVTNIFTGLGIAEVIAEDSDSDTLTKTWQWQNKIRIVVAPSVIGSQESFTEVGITGL